MSPQQRWEKVQQLCEVLERCPAPERQAKLERLEANESLRSEVVAMLEALEAEEQARSGHKNTLSEPDIELPSEIGPYQITGLLGRGGMGTVYAAELMRGGVVQRVAVKVLHSSLADAEMRQRFEREHRLLATLDHSGITRFLDAGITPQKQPYLVMERVDGQPIDQFCDGRTLDIVGRVRLVIEACEAVEAAHRKLIVHLDLKPSNLLVNQEGKVKLLDFGTAKLLDPLGQLTTTRQLTPLYASPEQLRGEAVSTACDVYALGVILYEILSGAWPYGNKESLASVTARAGGFAETRPLTQALTKQSVERLGIPLERARQELRGDLQVIVSKALRAEPQERYAGVGEFAADLRRWLEQRPILARPQTLWYRASKYARRNRGALGLTAMLALALVGALVYGWWQQQEKVLEGQRAQAAAQFLRWMVTSSNPIYGGKQNMTVLEMVERSAQLLEAERFAFSDMQIGLQGDLAAFLYSAGKVQQSEELLRKNLALAQQSKYALGIHASLQSLAGVEMGKGNCAESLKILSQLEQDYPALKQQMKLSTRISEIVNRGEIRGACEGKPPLSLEDIGQIKQLLSKLSDESLETAMPPRLFKALTLNAIAVAYQKMLRLPEARASVEEGLNLAKGNAQSQGVRIALLRTLSAIEYADKDIGASARALGQAVEASEGFTGPFEHERLRVMWARRLAENGEGERAAELARATIASARRQAAAIGQIRWMILVDGAVALRSSGNCSEVPAVMAEADALTQGKMPPQWRGNRLSAEGLCLAEMGRRNEAQPLLREALKLLGPMFSPTSKLKKDLEAALLP